MPSPKLEMVLDGQGHYVDASPPLLELLGYSLDEFKGLEPGAVGAAAAGPTAEIWTAFVDGEIDFPGGRPTELRRKDGSLVPAWFVGVAPGPREGTWVVSLDIRTEQTPPDIPPVLPVILSEWRAAERRLSQLALDDPRRPSEAVRVDQLRRLYQRESRRR